MVILHVDDDPDDREIFQVALKEIDPDINCISVFSSQHALTMLRNIIPDYIFLDINMPEMDGNECLSEIRKDRKYDGIIIIMFSTCIDASYRKKYDQLKSVPLEKPVNYIQLKKVLRAITGKFKRKHLWLTDEDAN